MTSDQLQAEPGQHMEDDHSCRVLCLASWLISFLEEGLGVDGTWLSACLSEINHTHAHVGSEIKTPPGNLGRQSATHPKPHSTSDPSQGFNRKSLSCVGLCRWPHTATCPLGPPGERGSAPAILDTSGRLSFCIAFVGSLAL